MDQNMKKEIGQRLFKKRKEREMSRAELGKLVNLHETTVKRYEDGEIKTLDIEKLTEFANALDTTASYLLGWTWDSYTMDLNDIEASVMHAYRDHPEKHIAVNKFLGVGVNEAYNPDPSLPLKEIELWDKYCSLDDHGKKIIDTILNEEYLRCMKAQNDPVIYTIPYAYDITASAGLGEYAMDIANFKTVRLTEAPPRGASFLVRVSGDSMEPMYYDGDIVFVGRTPYIEQGEIGVFYVEGDIYIKKLGANALISLNRKYQAIPLKDFFETKCYGRVLGKCTGIL